MDTRTKDERLKIRHTIIKSTTYKHHGRMINAVFFLLNKVASVMIIIITTIAKIRVTMTHQKRRTGTDCYSPT